MCADVTFSSVIIGDFSVDGKRQFCNDRRNLGRITVDWDEAHEKKVDYDLNLAMDKVRRKVMASYCNEGITHILQWILANKSHLKDVHFVTVRYVLRKLLLAQREKKELVLHVTRFRGTIYMSAWDSPEDIKARDHCSPESLKMGSWGYKFEQFMTDGSDPKTGNDENESYCCVVRTTLVELLSSRASQLSLVFSSEVDGVDSQTYKSNRLPQCQELVELKTQKMGPLHKGQELGDFKLRDCWTQCALVGIPRVVVGFRDDAGVVRRLRSFRMPEKVVGLVNADGIVFRIPKFDILVKPGKANRSFGQELMLRFLNEFLRWTKAEVKEDDPKVVYEIRVSEGRHTIRRLQPPFAVPVLPESYVRQILSN